MNLQDMLLAKIAEIDEGGFPYKIHLNCLMTDALDCPATIRNMYPSQITFTLDSKLNHAAKYDWNTRLFSFFASFGGNTSEIIIPADNIHVILNDCDQTIIQFGTIREDSNQTTEVRKQPNATEEVKAQVKALYTKKHLSLVVDNTL